MYCDMRRADVKVLPQTAVMAPDELKPAPMTPSPAGARAHGEVENTISTPRRLPGALAKAKKIRQE